MYEDADSVLDANKGITSRRRHGAVTASDRRSERRRT
jgi:hypothetical protein